MKRKAVSLLLALVIFTSNFTQVQAQEVENGNWIEEKLSDYEPLQKFLKEYPDAKLVQNNTEYILNTVTQDEAGNVISSKKTSFPDLESMNSYDSVQQDMNNVISPFTISPGGSVYKTYSNKIKVGLSTYKYSTTRYFISCTFQWLTTPAPASRDTIMGLAALALDSNMVMDGNTYGGRVSIYDGTTVKKMFNTTSGNLTVKASGINSIGFDFKYPVPVPLYVNGMDGVISCEALVNSQNKYCSIFGEYDDVTSALDLSNFSVSYPAGISVGIGTVRNQYTIQDALTIN